MSLLDAAGTHYLLETPEGTFAKPGAIEVLAARAALSADPAFPHLAGLVDIVAALTPLEDLSGVRIGKITAFDGPVAMEIIAAQLGDEVAMFPSSIADLGVGAGELYLARVNKAEGMRAAIERLGIAREDTIAFGDNLNDLEMIEFAGDWRGDVAPGCPRSSRSPTWSPQAPTRTASPPRSPTWGSLRAARAPTNHPCRT